MAVTRADVALAEARMLIENRTRWPAAPLIGAGAQWLRPGAIAGMAEDTALDDDAMGPLRATVRPMGVLDAAEILAQHGAYVARAADRLRSLGQGDAAMELEAENAEPDNAGWHKVRGQFLAMARARIEVEHPKIPDWIGEALQGPGVVDRFGEPEADALDAMPLSLLSERLDDLELGRIGADRRTQWVSRFKYPPVDIAIERTAWAKYGELWTAVKQAFDRAPAPTAWAGPTIPRRIMDKLAVANPALAQELMQRVPAVQVIDTGERSAQPSMLEGLLK